MSWRQDCDGRRRGTPSSSLFEPLCHTEEELRDKKKTYRCQNGKNGAATRQWILQRLQKDAYTYQDVIKGSCFKRRAYLKKKK